MYRIVTLGVVLLGIAASGSVEAHAEERSSRAASGISSHFLYRQLLSLGKANLLLRK